MDRGQDDPLLTAMPSIQQNILLFYMNSSCVPDTTYLFEPILQSVLDPQAKTWSWRHQVSTINLVGK